MCYGLFPATGELQGAKDTIDLNYFWLHLFFRPRCLSSFELNRFLPYQKQSMFNDRHVMTRLMRWVLQAVVLSGDDGLRGRGQGCQKNMPATVGMARVMCFSLRIQVKMFE